jgi:hypothetical protein
VLVVVVGDRADVGGEGKRNGGRGSWCEGASGVVRGQIWLMVVGENGMLVVEGER